MGPIRRALLKSLLLSAVKEHRAAGRPQLAGLAFDHITAKIHLDGRFADAEIAALERHVFPKLAKGTALDIGANIGDHAVAFAPHFYAVHSFEPNTRALDLLRLNAKLAGNITVHGFGLSNSDQTLTVTEPEGNLGGTGSHARGGGREVKLPLRTLDSALPELGLTGPITFAKIDVEGHEPQAIQGAQATLSEHKPVLGLEIDRRQVTSGTSPAVEAASALGYTKLFELGSGGLEHITSLKAKNYPLLLLTAKDELG